MLRHVVCKALGGGLGGLAYVRGVLGVGCAATLNGALSRAIYNIVRDKLLAHPSHCHSRNVGTPSYFGIVPLTPLFIFQQRFNGAAYLRYSRR